MYYTNNRYYHSSNDYGKILLTLGIFILIALLIGWIVMECTHTRTFTGKLHSKNTEIWYTHDEERLVSSIDSDGNLSTHTEGTDETTAHIKYVLNFYSEGKLRSVSAGNYHATVYRLHAEQMAYQKLMSSHNEPPHYTYSKESEDYLVDLSGWLVDGVIKDLTILRFVPREKN